MSGIKQDISNKKHALWSDAHDNESTACGSTLVALTELEIESTAGSSCIMHATLAHIEEQDAADGVESGNAEISDLETETATTSNMSKSRPAYMRSENRKARRREAHIARAVAKNA
ncbi:MAG: hypothetical protein ACKPKO_26130, partial [Candidatus Fonsibacter sp.]